MSKDALEKWKLKLDHLEVALVNAADPAQIFAIEADIEKAKAKIQELSASESPVIVDLAQQRRIRDFVMIVDRALEEFEISTNKDAPEWQCLTGMKNGQRPCNPENLTLVGGGLWNLVGDTISRGGRHKIFDTF